MYPVDGPAELVEVSQGLGVVFDGELLGYDSSFPDLEAKVSPGTGELYFCFTNFKTCRFNGLYSFIQCRI